MLVWRGSREWRATSASPPATGSVSFISAPIVLRRGDVGVVYLRSATVVVEITGGPQDGWNCARSFPTPKRAAWERARLEAFRDDLAAFTPVAAPKRVKDLWYNSALLNWKVARARTAAAAAAQCSPPSLQKAAESAATRERRLALFPGDSIAALVASLASRPPRASTAFLGALRKEIIAKREVEEEAAAARAAAHQAAPGLLALMDEEEAALEALFRAVDSPSSESEASAEAGAGASAHASKRPRATHPACPVCFGEDRAPFSLKCGHVICEGCVVHLARDLARDLARAASCPLCRETFSFGDLRRVFL